MDVPTCSANSRSIPAFPCSEVRKVTHLMGKPASRSTENQLRVALDVAGLFLKSRKWQLDRVSTVTR